MNKLNWPKAIVISSIILATAIVVASFASPAISQGRGGSSYMIASDGGQFVWRVNVATGSVSYCLRRDNSTDQKFIGERPPFCSASTPPMQ